MKNIEATCNFNNIGGKQLLHNLSIDFPERRNIFGQRKTIDVHITDFYVKVTAHPDYLEADYKNLIQLSVLGKTTAPASNLKNIHLSDYKNPYEVWLNTGAIHDCTNLKAENAKIDFKIIAKLDGQEVRKDLSLTLNLIKAKPNLKLSFEPLPSITYKPENIKIGELKIENACGLRFSEPSSAELHIHYPEILLKESVTFGDLKDIREDNPYYEPSSGLMNLEDEIPSVLKVEKTGSQTLFLRTIVAKNVISVPVMFDLSKLSNPAEDIKKYPFMVQYKNILSGSVENSVFEIEIAKDKQTTKLMVECNGETVENQSSDYYGSYRWIQYHPGTSNRFKGMICVCNIKIGNRAIVRNPDMNGAVYFRNLRMAPVIPSGILAQGAFPFIEMPQVDAEVRKFENGNNAWADYRIYLKHEYIKDIPDNFADIAFKLSFDYRESLAGQEEAEKEEWKYFEATLNINIEKDPGNEWLCVDFGTSATVATFGNGAELSEITILNLDRRNEEVLEQKERSPLFRGPRFEEGTPFLSSNMMFSPGQPEIMNIKGDTGLVYLSPGVPRFHGDGFRLPYLKALVGYKDIPNPERYEAFVYKENGVAKKFSDHPLDISTVFQSAYRTLFHDYIVKSLPNKTLVNKIILTVPNTYTPHHIEYIKSIVAREIPSLRKEYIWFVSESDAIAYYYLNHWNDFHADDSGSDLNGDENVLIYDMGAGTLDLTYLSISKDKEGKVSVKIHSKLGLNKAGNYIDYLIAKTLVEIYPSKFPKEILEPSYDPVMQNLTGKLKHFIKTHLKPVLFSQDKIVFSDWNEQRLADYEFQDEEIDLRKVRENSLISDFVKECTDELFRRFAKINGLVPDETKIDTLIMTGRSIQFGNIKNRLEYCINTWNDDEHCNSITIEGNALKTIVSQGALYYATLYGSRYSSITLENKNIYASYGVMYKDSSNRWKYQRLLDSSTQPTGKASPLSSQNNGLQIFTYDTDRHSAGMNGEKIEIDLRHTIEAYLIQSYSPNPEQDFKDDERRNDYISIIYPFSPVSVAMDPRKVALRLEVNDKNEMIFTAGSTVFEASSPVKIDIEKNVTFRHSMWPYL